MEESPYHADMWHGRTRPSCFDEFVSNSWIRLDKFCQSALFYSGIQMENADSEGRFTILRLKNLRCFEEAEIPLDPRVTVIIGENGAGKTTVAEAMASLSSGEDEGLRHFPLRLGVLVGNDRSTNDCRKPATSLPTVDTAGYTIQRHGIWTGTSRWSPSIVSPYWMSWRIRRSSAAPQLSTAPMAACCVISAAIVEQ